MRDMILAVLFLFAPFSVCNAGICWKTKRPDGTCTDFHGKYNSEKECCEKGGRAYSKDATKKPIFYYVFLVPPSCTLCNNNPCSKTSCLRNKKCKLSRSGNPICVCDLKCTDFKTGQVCGSDGRTYASECLLRQWSCIFNRSHLRVEYNGPCKRNCIGVQCASNQVCIAGKKGTSYCIHSNCPSKCPQIVNKVCGTDKKEYLNECALKKASCLNGRRIHFAYLGPCTGKSSCDSVRCPENSKCILDANNQPRCEDCGCNPSEEGLAVCGSDGKRYKSWCHMRKTSCATGRIIRVDPSRKC